MIRNCNLNCKYCFIKDDSKEHLNLDELKKVIDRLYFLGCRFISFFGGEPTIRDDFTDIVAYATSKGIITHMSTNGILLTPEYIDELCQAGIDIINLSIDSVFKFNFSDKDFVKSRKVLDNLISARQKYGIELNVNMVLNNKNVKNAVETIKALKPYKIPLSIGLIIKNTYSNKEQDKKLFFNEAEEREVLFETLVEIKKLKKQGYNILEPASYFDDIREFYEKELEWYCCAGEYYFSVDCDGKFQICAGLPAENISIFDIDKDYYEKMSAARTAKLEICNKVCLSNCLYDTSYFIKHPGNFIRDSL